jgi:hypothetical protein
LLSDHHTSGGIRRWQQNLKPAGLTVAQIELVGQFNDCDWENSKLSFEEVARKELGPNPFPKTPNGQKFRRGCKAIFDRERQS